MLTGALCQALIVKKEVSPDRFMLPEMSKEPMQCPDQCHACCSSSTILDLTAVESLVIFLLNREMVELIEEYWEDHEPSGYCPFMVTDKCVIHAYKPTACQMYMPFAYQGDPMCFYIAPDDFKMNQDSAEESYMNSKSYDIHGFMAIIQNEIDSYITPSFFKNIYQGILWWKNNYDCLPDATRICLESIMLEDYIGLKIAEDFKFEAALVSGYAHYALMLENRTT